MKIGLSIVVYNYYHKDLFQLLDELSLLSVNVYVINTGDSIEINTSKLKYYKIDNVGYGRANNFAIEQSIKDGNEFHVVCNPDVAFSYDDIHKLVKYMETDKNIAVVQPKIVNEKNEEQFLVRRLPSPKDLLFRRFNPFYKEGKFECRNYSFKYPANFPILSGSFLVFRVSSIIEMNSFDPRFFLYLEDYDLIRRFHKKYKTMYYPYVSIMHIHNQESYRTMKAMFIHVKSAIKYFNKWGWIFDKERRKTNIKLEQHIRELDYND